MTDRHIIAVEYGNIETIYPITKDHAPIDTATLLTTDSKYTEEIEHTLSHLLGIDCTILETPTFNDRFTTAYNGLSKIVERGNTAWINATESNGAVLLAASTFAMMNPANRQFLKAYTATEEGCEELPLVPDPGYPNDGMHILETIAENDAASVTELARIVSDGELDESERSRIQYTVRRLAECGFVDRERVGNAMKPVLSPMGELWFEVND